MSTLLIYTSKFLDYYLAPNIVIGFYFLKKEKTAKKPEGNLQNGRQPPDYWSHYDFNEVSGWGREKGVVFPTPLLPRGQTACEKEFYTVESIYTRAVIKGERM